MLMAVPFEAVHKIFKHKAMSSTFRLLSSHRLVTSSALRREARVSHETLRRMIRSLERAEYVVKEGRKIMATDKVRQDDLIINLRDTRIDCLMRWKITRQLLYLLHMKPHITLSGMANILGVSLETVKVVLKNLRLAGLVCGKQLNPKLVVKPTNPLDLVPRSTHRQAVDHFISIIKQRRPEFDETLVLFGEASWGRPTIMLNIAVLTTKDKLPEILALSKDLAFVSENVTLNFGATIDLTLMLRKIWLLLKSGHVKNPSLLANEILEGICVHGQLPRDEELYELDRMTYPLPKTKVQELLMKGYVERKGSKLVYTDRAIDAFKCNKSVMTEDIIPIDGKKIRLIGVVPPAEIPSQTG